MGHDRIYGQAGRERITKIFFDKNGIGWAIGESGASFVLQDDKITWKKEPSPISYLMLDGIFTDDSNGAIVGAGGSIIFTEDSRLIVESSDNCWKIVTKLNSLFFINQKTGWTVGNEGKIYQTINGGKFWREQNSTVKTNLTDVFFKNTAEGWAVGEDGTVLHTKTAGNVWMTENVKSQHKLEKIFFTEKKGWIVGFGGLILTYEASETDKFTVKPQLKLKN